MAQDRAPSLSDEDIFGHIKITTEEEIRQGLEYWQRRRREAEPENMDEPLVPNDEVDQGRLQDSTPARGKEDPTRVHKSNTGTAGREGLIDLGDPDDEVSTSSTATLKDSQAAPTTRAPSPRDQPFATSDCSKKEAGVEG